MNDDDDDDYKKKTKKNKMMMVLWCFFYCPIVSLHLCVCVCCRVLLTDKIEMLFQLYYDW